MGWDPNRDSGPAGRADVRAQSSSTGRSRSARTTRDAASCTESHRTAAERAELTDPRFGRNHVDFDDDERWLLVDRSGVRIAVNLSAQERTVPLAGTRGHGAAADRRRRLGGGRRAAAGAAQFYGAGTTLGMTPSRDASGGRRWIFGDQLGPHFLDSDDQPVLLDRVAKGVRPTTIPPAEGPPGAVRDAAPGRGARRPVRLPNRRHATAERVGGSASCPCAIRRATPPVTSSSGCRRSTVLPARGFATSMDEFAAMGARPRIAAAADGGLLPGPRAPARRADGRRRAGRRPVELRRREPRTAANRSAAAAPGRRALGRARAVVAGRGRDRRARCAPTSTAGNGDGDVSLRRGRRSAPVRRHPRRGAGGAAATSSPTGCRPSGRTRTRCSPATRGWRTPCCPAPLNLGLLDPLEVVRRAESGLPGGRRPRSPSAEGFVRQVIGWRDYMWNLYWHLGPDYRRRNALARPASDARPGSPSWTPTPSRRAACPTCWRELREHGWVHHIPRLMVLGNYALQRGWRPVAGDRLVPPRVRRRLRLGDGAERRRDVAARRRRADRHQALRRRRRVHRPDERLLRRLPLPTRRSGSARTPARTPPATGAFLDRHRERLRRQPPDGATAARARPARATSPRSVEQERARGSTPP